ncbi:hypothetical protein DIPPA_26992 [Diplonema papillatum]|nr:hypothetical protein DIPPA_26992 [Diplonema papillatum]
MHGSLFMRLAGTVLPLACSASVSVVLLLRRAPARGRRLAYGWVYGPPAASAAKPACCAAAAATAGPRAPKCPSSGGPAHASSARWSAQTPQATGREVVRPVACGIVRRGRRFSWPFLWPLSSRGCSLCLSVAGKMLRASELFARPPGGPWCW